MSQEPVSSAPEAKLLQEAIEICRRPFTAAAVKWKIQTNPKADDKPAVVVAFIDARLAGERLNHAGLIWSNRFTPQTDGGLECTLIVRSATTGQILAERSDVGYAPSNDRDRGMGIKSIRSDAFKRAAVHYGVGVSIYALPLKRLYAKDDHIVKRGNSWYITSKGEAALDKHYEEWLKKVGEKTFGKAIDHGDQKDAQGDVESVDRASSEDVAPTPSAAPAPKVEPKPEPKAEEPVELTGEKGATAILEKYAQSAKTIDDVKTFLTSRGVEDTSGLTGTLEEAGAFLEALPKATGAGLYKWLKNAAAKREREEAGE